MKKNLLTNLVIDEISLVDRPANPGAQVVLFKRDDAGVEKDGGKTFDQIEAQRVVLDSYYRLTETLRASIVSILGDEGIKDKGGKIKETVDQFAERVKGAFNKSEASDDATDAGGSGEPSGGESSMKIEKQTDLAAANAQIEALSKQIETLTATLKKHNLAVDDDSVLKGLSPEARQIIEKAQADAKAANEKAEALQKANAERDAEATARTIMGQVPGDAKKLASVLAKLDKDGVETLTAVFKSANGLLDEAKAAGLFTATGTSAAASGQESPIVKRAKAAREAAAKRAA